MTSAFSKRVRDSARNYTPRPAQKRLDETVAPFRQQILNSLAVDAVQADVYVAAASGTRCLCEATSALSTPTSSSVPPQVTNDDQPIVINTQDFLFGEPGIDKWATHAGGEELGLDTSNPTLGITSSNIWQAGSCDCGICYRNGWLPGYSCVTTSRIVLTHRNVDSAVGYTTTVGECGIASLENLGRWDAQVVFELCVPRWWTSATFSVRNNAQVLTDSLFTPSGSPLTVDWLRTFSGTTATIAVRAAMFSHVVVEFDLGVPRTLVNVSGETYSLDYQILDTLGSLNVVIPPTLANLKSNDVLVLRGRNLVLKVTDVTRFQTSTKHMLEFVATTRVVQPQETIHNLPVGFTLP